MALLLGYLSVKNKQREYEFEFRGLAVSLGSVEVLTVKTAAL